jgi:hypothetical protein
MCIHYLHDIHPPTPLLTTSPSHQFHPPLPGAAPVPPSCSPL